MQNYGRTKFRLIFKIIAIFLIQAFVVLDFAWAGALDLQINKISQKKSRAIFLSPKMQLDANTLQGVFLQALSPLGTDRIQAENINKDVQEKKIDRPEKLNITQHIRQFIVTALLFIILVMPFFSVSNGWTMGSQAPPAATQTMPQELQPLLYKLPKGVDKLSDIDNKNRSDVIYTGVEGKGINYTNKKAVEKVAQINKAIDIIWQRQLKAGKLDPYITKRGYSQEAVAIGKGLLLLKTVYPSTFNGLKERNARLYIADIPYKGTTFGSKLAGRMGTPIIQINPKYIDNPYMIAYLLVHEGLHGIELPGGIIGYVFKNNPVRFVQLVADSIPEEDDAYLEEVNFSAKFGIMPEEGDVYVSSFDRKAEYRKMWEQLFWEYLLGTVYWLAGLFYACKTFINLIFKKNINRNSRTTSTGTSYKSAANKRILRKNKNRRNRYKSVILLPLLYLLDAAEPFKAAAFDNSAQEALNKILLMNLGVVSIGIIISLIVLRQNIKLRSLLKQKDEILRQGEVVAENTESTVDDGPLKSQPEQNIKVNVFVNIVFKIALLTGSDKEFKVQRLLDGFGLSQRDREIAQSLFFDKRGNLLKREEILKIFNAFFELGKKYSDLSFSKLQAKTVINETSAMIALSGGSNANNNVFNKAMVLDQVAEFLKQQAEILNLQKKGMTFSVLKVEQAI